MNSQKKLIVSTEVKKDAKWRLIIIALSQKARGEEELFFCYHTYSHPFYSLDFLFPPPASYRHHQGSGSKSSSSHEQSVSQTNSTDKNT